MFFFSLNLVIVVSNSAPEDGMIAIDLKELEFTFFSWPSPSWYVEPAIMHGSDGFSVEALRRTCCYF